MARASYSTTPLLRSLVHRPQGVILVNNNKGKSSSLTRAQLGGGGWTLPPWGFSRQLKNGGVQRRRFLHSCSDNSSATFLKILGPGHQRSGHQVRSSNPTSEKNDNRVTATVVERKIWNFHDLVYYQVPTTCISRIFYIGDLRSGQFRDLPIISQWGKNSNASNTDQICSNCSKPRSIRLLLMTSVQLCICDPRKGHWRSNNDVMRSMYVFAYKFWLEWGRDLGHVLKCYLVQTHRRYATWPS